MPKLYNFLLVDDSLLDLFIHKKMISISNIASSITTFNSAEEALEYLRENESLLVESIMLLDLQMPGMNGFKFIEVFATLSDRVKNALRIFILSSTVDHGDIKLARENPYIEDMISKPVDVNALKIKLEAREV